MMISLPRTALILALCAGSALAACDAPADEQAAVPQSTEPQAGDAVVTEGAPGTTASSPPAISGDLDESSMGEESPAGEAVTEEELPQSDLPPPSREAFTDSSCDFESWVGQPVDEAAVKETGRVYRILKPDSMMTMDHNPERLNVVHDDDGKVTRVWCG